MGFPLTPAQRDWIVAQAKAGIGPRQIQRQAGFPVSRSGVYNVLSAARKRGEPIGLFPKNRKLADAHGVFRIVIWESGIGQAIAAAAEARRITVSELLKRLVETAVADRMIDAILDDGRDSAP